MKPLEGWRVVVTRPPGRAESLVEAVSAAGGEPVPLALIVIEPAPADEPSLAELERAADLDALIFTSVPAVEHALARHDGNWPPRLLAVGEATAKALAAAGLEPVRPADGSDSEALLALPELAAVEGWRIGIVAAPGGRQKLAETLAGRGARVVTIAPYRRRRVSPEADRLEALAEGFSRTLLTATSGQLLEALDGCLAEAGLDGHDRPLVVVSERVAERARALGYRRVASAGGADDARLLAALTALAGSAGGANAVDSTPPSQTADDAMADESDRSSSEPRQPEPGPEPETPAAGAAGARKSGGGALAGLSLVLALAAAGLAGWTAWQWQHYEPPAVDLPVMPDVGAELAAQRQRAQTARAELREALEARLDRAEQRLDERLESARADLVDRIERSADRGAQRVDELAAEVRRERDGLERRLAAAEDGLARLSAQGLGSERALAAAEAEFLLRLAQERLTLFGDANAAARAMRLADDQLKALDDALYDGVRQALAAEIQALEAVEVPDRVALSGRLLQLAAASTEWPLDARRSLRGEGPNLVEPDPAETGLLARTRAVLSGLVQVHREETDATVLLTLEEEHLLRENVQLQLQVAELAAVRGEQGLYRDAIGLVRDWLDRYYDPASSQVAEVAATLADLQQAELLAPLPETGDALRRLRNLRATRAVGDASP